MKVAVATGLFAFLLAGTAMAQGYNQVSPYTRRDGTYVQPHYRTNPDNTVRNNWTTVPNVNPFTGQPGTRSPTPRAPSQYIPGRRY